MSKTSRATQVDGKGLERLLRRAGGETEEGNAPRERPPGSPLVIL